MAGMVRGPWSDRDTLKTFLSAGYAAGAGDARAVREKGGGRWEVREGRSGPPKNFNGEDDAAAPRPSRAGPPSPGRGGFGTEALQRLFHQSGSRRTACRLGTQGMRRETRKPPANAPIG